MTRLAGYVSRMGFMINPYKPRVEKFDKQRQIGGPISRREETLIYILNNRSYMIRELGSSGTGKSVVELL